MLLRQYWRQEAPGLLGWSLALAASVFLMVGLYPAIRDSAGLPEVNRIAEQLPPAMKAYMGGVTDLASLAGWLQVSVFGTVATDLLLVWTALACADILTREVDHRTMEFLLSLPVGRSQVLGSRFLGLALNLAVLHGVLLASTGLAVTWVGGDADWRAYALAALNAYVVLLALGSLLLALTVFIDDYPRGLMSTMGVSIVVYFLNFVIEPGSRVAWLRRLSFFYYYDPGQVLRTATVPWDRVLFLALAAAGLAGLAAWLFNRKQLAA